MLNNTPYDLGFRFSICEYIVASQIIILLRFETTIVFSFGQVFKHSSANNDEPKKIL